MKELVLKHSKLVFGLIAVLGAVIVIFWLFFTWMGALAVPTLHHAHDENDLLLDVSVDNTDPLILSVKVKSNCTDDNLYLAVARIKDYNETTVAEYRGEWVDGSDGYFEPICVLQNFGSEELLTLNFETSLPSGNYTLWFCSYAMVLYPFAHTDFIIS
jgi:hypothetical protein